MEDFSITELDLIWFGLLWRRQPLHLCFSSTLRKPLTCIP